MSFDLLIYYLTSINQYSFTLLIFLFLLTFFIKMKERKIIFPIRILLGIAIFYFYLIGWYTYDTLKNDPHIGKLIPYNNKIVKISMLKINEETHSQYYNPILARKYVYTLLSPNNDLFVFGRGKNLFIKEKNNVHLAKNNYKVIGVIKVSPTGILSKSFGNKYTMILIQNNIDSTNYIVSKSILKEEK